LRSELSRWCTLLALSTSITTSVSSLTITTVTTTSATSTERLALALTLTAHHATRRSMGSLLLDMGSRNNLCGKVKPFAEVVETFGGEGIVVILPGELSLDVAAGGKRLASLDDVEVLGVNVVVFWEVVVLLCDEDTLSEEVLVDLLAVCLWNKPESD
jgi:hypothetical protein